MIKCLWNAIGYFLFCKPLLDTTTVTAVPLRRLNIITGNENHENEPVLPVVSEKTNPTYSTHGSLRFRLTKPAISSYSERGVDNHNLFTSYIIANWIYSL